MTIFAIILVCVVLFQKQVRLVLAAILEAPTSVFHAGESLCRRVVLGALNWLRTEVPTPSSTLKGLIALGVGIVAAVADFFVIQKTIRVIFPWHVAEMYVALSFVALTGVIGFLTHSVKRWSERILLLCICLLLIGMAGKLAHERSVEQRRVKNIMTHDVSQLPSGSLRIDGAPISGENDTDLRSDQEKPATLGYSDWLAAGTAMLLTAAGLVAFWKGFELAGPAVAWAVFSPTLLVPGVLLLLCFVATRLAQAIARALDGFVEIFDRLSVQLTILNGWLSDYRQRRAKHKIEREMELENLRIQQQIESLHHEAKLQRVKVAEEMELQQLGQESECVIECHEEALQNVRENHRQLIRETTDTVKARACGLIQERVQSTSERLVESCLAPFTRVSSAIASLAHSVFRR